ncbi:serrate RNA effector molecule homolog, partial [Clupea harengus]|uniref:Serrate RNA effector molecule homolog n=1 Tax=Clupea harengus TaxID=7950 RepID=A0A8M1K551_CLUHA
RGLRFRLRYHPEDTERRDAETHNALQKRLGVFMYLLGKGWFDNVTLDIAQAPAIIKVLDAVQIRFEGGTENDLRVLEMPTKKQGEKEERRKGEEEERRKKEERRKEERRKGEEERRKREEEERRKKEERRKEERLLSGEIQSEAQKQDEGQAVDPENILTPGAEKLARKRKHIEGEDISESAAAASILHPFDQSAEWETGGKKRTEDTSNRDKEDKKGYYSTQVAAVPSSFSLLVLFSFFVEMKRYIEEEEDEGEKAEDGKSEESEDGEVGKGGQTENKIDEERGDEREEERGDERGDDGGEKRGEGDKEARRDAPPLPRQLHKTRSLFMRGIPPSICKKEIVNLFVKYPGFMRVCLSEPHADHRFFRRCWVTFDYLANIQDICLQLQNARWHDYKLSPVVHRELCRRVRAANGITQHRTLLQDHIRLAAKLIRTLDRRWTFWGEDHDQGNPVLRNVSQHLVEEVSAEEEELTGHVGGVIPQSEVAVETDNKLVKVLDCLLLYLRIVHSVDFYSACQHSGEHDMPSCCGTVHVRGPTPASRVPVEQVLDWQKRFEDKLNHLFFPRERLGDEEAENMGRRHSQQEVEKFVTANTRELDKEKWLCVLCGKRFKGSEFVRKHLLARHGEEVEEVRKEALFFNNFLMDPKRPYFPGMRSPPPRPPRPGQEGGGPGLPFSPLCLWGFGKTSPPLVSYEDEPTPRQL